MIHFSARADHSLAIACAQRRTYENETVGISVTVHFQPASGIGRCATRYVGLAEYGILKAEIAGLGFRTGHNTEEHQNKNTAPEKREIR
jgi:hypothetical protein